MDFKEILTSVIMSIVGAVVSGVGAMLMSWIKNKIKDEKDLKLITEAYKVVSDAVDYVYQIYVENLKGTDLWDDKAMLSAKEQAVNYIKQNLPKEVMTFLEKNGQNLAMWIDDQIEVAIKKQKER